MVLRTATIIIIVIIILQKGKWSKDDAGNAANRSNAGPCVFPHFVHEISYGPLVWAPSFFERL